MTYNTCRLVKEADSSLSKKPGTHTLNYVLSVKRIVQIFKFAKAEQIFLSQACAGLRTPGFLNTAFVATSVCLCVCVCVCLCVCLCVHPRGY